MSRARLALHQVGRRGAFLLFLAILDGVYGLALLRQVPPPAHGTGSDLLLSPQAWAAIWIGTGIVCAACSVVRRDRVAFTLAAALKTAWAGVATWQWATGRLPTGWLSGVVWLAFAAVVLIVASWPEVPPALPDGT